MKLYMQCINQELPVRLGAKGTIYILKTVTS